MSRNGLLRTASFLATALATGIALAADVVRPPIIAPAPVVALPAVSQPNGKVALFGGSIDNVSGWGVAGAFSIPVGQRFGLQLDGVAGSGGGTGFWGVGGHAFWRNPTQGLFGLYASWVDWSPLGAKVSKFGAEGELYRGPFSLEGVLAYQNGTFSGIAGSVTAAFYARPNLRLDASYRFLQGVGNIGGVGVEFQPNLKGRPSALSLFASGDWGEDGYQTIIGGVKFYAGPQKDLIRRHREDDPHLLLPWDLNVVPPPPPPPPLILTDPNS